MITARRLGAVLLRRLTTVLAFAGLGVVAAWGMSTGWRLESPFVAAASADDPPDESAPPIRVIPGPEPVSDGSPPVIRARVVFATADDVRRAGFAFAAAEARPLTRYVTAAASIGYDPGFYFQLATRAAGTVWWVEKVPGQPVAKGEVLALLDVAEVGRLKADLLADLTHFEFQIQTLDRLKDATQATNLPSRSVEEARVAAESARFKMLGDQQALLNLGLSVDPDILRKVPTADRVGRIRFMGLPESVLDRVRDQTASANLLPVVSPLDGFVITRPVTRGEAVGVHKPLFVVAGLRQVHIELAVDPRDADLLKVGQKVLFNPNGSSGFEARGTLAHLVPEVDEATRKVWAHAEAENPDGRLRPNAFGRGRIVIGEDPAAVVVPDAAVQRDGADALVFVRVDATTFEARRVSPGIRGDGVTAVDRVRPGEAVVTTGSHALLAELRRDQLGSGD